MSQYKMLSDDGKYVIRYGWDQPLKTYFASVGTQESDSTALKLWVGTNPGEIQSVRELADYLTPYVELSQLSIAQLKKDAHTI